MAAPLARRLLPSRCRLSTSHHIPSRVPCRSLTSSAAMAAKTPDDNAIAQLNADIKALVQNGWTLNEQDAPSLKKTYYFKTYTKVADLHHVIATKSKAKNHHPRMISTFGSLTVQWTTHSIRGLSPKDIALARYSDQEAESIGTVKQSEAPRCGPVSAI